ncbi:tetratricopeptide repeat protein [bacterium]|nr:tetratricopeptide repeat protein [bacterium]
MLRPKKKLHKKEIKEDALVTRYFQARRFYDQNSRMVNTVLIVVLALAVIGVFMARSRRIEELKAQSALGDALQSLYMNDPGTLIRKMDEVTKKFSGTPAAGEAAFFAANALFETGDLKEADRRFAMVMDGHGGNPVFRASSLAGRAAIAESEKRWQDAARLYTQAAEKYPDLFTAPFYLKEAARCQLEAGDRKSARAVLETIEKRFPESQVSQETEWMKLSM